MAIFVIIGILIKFRIASLKVQIPAKAEITQHVCVPKTRFGGVCKCWLKLLQNQSDATYFQFTQISHVHPGIA